MPRWRKTVYNEVEESEEEDEEENDADNEKTNNVEDDESHDSLFPFTLQTSYEIQSRTSKKATLRCS